MATIKSIIGHYIGQLRYGHKKLKSQEGGLLVKHYGNVDDYYKHQKFKNKYVDLRDYGKKFTQFLKGNFDSWEFGEGQSVLCLAARDGTEVEYFKDRGCFAVGIDLLPINKTSVLEGDFHKLNFASNSVEIVYTNSIDHCLNPKRVFDEVYRVLKKGGYFVLDNISFGMDDGTYETCRFENETVLKELLSKFEQYKRFPSSRSKYTVYIMRKKK